MYDKIMILVMQYGYGVQGSVRSASSSTAGSKVSDVSSSGSKSSSSARQRTTSLPM